ncbi:(4Fe-4S)-binding protein [Flavobacteriaceae bacterium F08102]|nr:(4Fe-4S)-binding protein [Flavobacteriaceae bacterium F08102]
MEPSKEIIKKYHNGEITILWKPKKCIHSGACVDALPKVYRPTEKPWIQQNQATTAELKAQIVTCPSGALSYVVNDEHNEVKEIPSGVLVEVREKGPLLVKGTVQITHADGRKEVRENVTTFCRCGASENKPFCDGTHRAIDFIA